MTRRAFLLMIASVAAIAASALTAMRSGILGRIVRYKLPKRDRSYPLGLLSDEESRTISALIPVLVGGDHPFLREHVARRTATKAGYLKEYQNAVRLLTATTRRIRGRATRFEDLDIGERDRILEAILWRYSARDRWMVRLENLFVSRERLAFRKYVIRDILKAFYRSGAGWLVVGYTKYPGIPARDPLEYTKPVEA